MNYKALHDLTTGDKVFESGKVYTAEQVEGVDLTHFESVSELPTEEKVVDNSEEKELGAVNEDVNVEKKDEDLDDSSQNGDVNIIE